LAEARGEVSSYQKQIEPFKELFKLSQEDFLILLGDFKRRAENAIWKDQPEIKEAHPEFSGDLMALQKALEQKIVEKGQIVIYLEKAQTLLKTRIEIEGEKDKINLAEQAKL